MYWDQLDNEVMIEELTPFVGVVYATRIINVKEVDKLCKQLIHSYNASLGIDCHEVTQRLNDVEGVF